MPAISDRHPRFRAHIRTRERLLPFVCPAHVRHRQRKTAAEFCLPFRQSLTFRPCIHMYALWRVQLVYGSSRGMPGRISLLTEADPQIATLGGRQAQKPRMPAFEAERTQLIHPHAKKFLCARALSLARAARATDQKERMRFKSNRMGSKGALTAPA